MRWFRSSSSDERLDLELRDHIERQVADYAASGMSQQEARRRVRIEFGGLEQAKEHVRDIRPHQWSSELVRDARIGLRSLRREPLFALSVTIILTVAIGASVAMFSVLHTVVLRALPYPRASELAMIRTHLMLQNQPDGTSLPNWFDWRRESKAFAGMTFYLRTAVSAVTFAGRDAPQRGVAGLVGPDFFEVVGTTPLIGRTPSSDDFNRREHVVVLSEGLWQEQFARSADALGQSMLIDGEPHTIIGVMPYAFQIPSNDTRLWRPISASPFREIADLSKMSGLQRDGDAFEVIGRLAPHRTIDEGQADMRLIAARLRETYEGNKNLDVRVTPLFDYVVGEQTQRGVWLGFAAVLALLAIACANVGGLLSVRAMRRRQEFAVRSALGAGRWRMIRQLVAESVVLWAIASTGGVALAYGLMRLLLLYGPRSVPRLEQLGLDAAAVTMALAGGLLVIIVCGTIPSLVSSRMRRAGALVTRDQSSHPRPRVQDGLVCAQIAGALVLLVGAVLFAESFLRAQTEDPGYAADNLMIVRIELPRTYADGATWARFFNDASARLKTVPGVVGVGATMDFFMRRNGDQSVTVEGRIVDPDAPRQRLTIEGVTPGFFEVASIELVEGRLFDERDVAPGAAPVYIVNELMARQLWPGESPVGKRMVNGRQPRKDGRWDTVVGVVRNVRREGLDLRPFLTAYNPLSLRSYDLVIRATTSVEELIPVVRRELQSVDASVPLTQISTVRSRLSERLSGRRFQVQALGLFAAIALVLAAAGLYALMAYHVTMRTREMGIRSALGADRRSILTMVLGHGVRLAVAGVLAGVVIAVSAARLLQSLLYNTPAIDAWRYAGASIGMLLIAGIAACVPAFRAAQVNPMTALREE
jgi:putative ABC transport system permease protein